MTTHRAMPVLEVTAVARASAFCQRLGFADHGAWEYGGVARFTIVERGDVTLGLTQHDNPARHHWWAACLYVSDAKALRDAFMTEGIECTRMHHPEHDGCIDFDMIDPDGHRIAFGQSLDPRPGPGLGDDRGKG